MDKRFLIWENPKQAVLTLVAVLMLAGCVNVFSASFAAADDMFGDGFYYLKRYVAFGAVSLAAMYFVQRMNYKKLLSERFMTLTCLGVFALLILVKVVGIANKGAQRWLYIGGFSIQPSELAKLAVVLLCAGTLWRFLKNRRPVELLSPPSVLMGLIVAGYFILVELQPDLGTAAIIVALAFGMYVLAGMRLLPIFGCIGAGLLFVVGLVLAKPYRLERVKVWFDPWLDEADSGYQMVQSLLAIGSGGLTGMDWGHGTGKFFYLPEAHTDFAFAIFCQENGFLGALFLILAFTLLGAAFFRIAVGAKDERGFLLSAGCSLLLIGQAAANMAMVCGILPVIGVPLTFISYGGTSMLVSLLAVGLILSVYNEEVKSRALEAENNRPPEERRGDLRFVGRRERR